ncbi:hypothetical protein DFJ73DRAFT_799453 [Zopfochytrium polystomum]|nr:hypothetical protein DFJ73DRAFT_799453 [Zopfochytrium polystomum]
MKPSGGALDNYGTVNIVWVLSAGISLVVHADGYPIAAQLLQSCRTGRDFLLSLLLLSSAWRTRDSVWRNFWTAKIVLSGGRWKMAINSSAITFCCRCPACGVLGDPSRQLPQRPLIADVIPFCIFRLTALLVFRKLADFRSPRILTWGEFFPSDVPRLSISCTRADAEIAVNQVSSECTMLIV